MGGSPSQVERQVVKDRCVVPDTLKNYSVTPRRARVLHLAFACSPWRGSEPGVGWRRAFEAAKYSDVWVICEQHEYEHQIGSYLEETGEVDGLRFEFVPQTPLEQRLSKIPGVYYLAYRNWHRRAIRSARKLHGQVHFDLVHQVTLCGYREPGELHTMNLPLVWGPVGGTQNYPWKALTQAGWWGGLQEAIRSTLNSLQLRFSRRVRRAARRADCLLAANTTNGRDLERMIGRPVPVMLETGSPPVAPRESHSRSPAIENRPLRLLWAGNLLAFKALPLLLDAMAQLPPSCDVRLRVVGDGPEQRRWQRLAKKLEIDDRIEWVGRVRDVEMQPQYQWADLLPFTSLRDTSGNVIFEALSNGVPVIGANHQGVGDIVTPDCGLKIEVDTSARMAAGYRDAILSLYEDPHQLQRLSEGAIERAIELSWPRQGERMRDYYRQLLGEDFEWRPREAVIPAATAVEVG